MSDNKINVTPIGHRAHWARTRTEFDPPESDNMQGASEPQPVRVVSPTVKHCGDRIERAVDELIAAMTLAVRLSDLAPTDTDRAFLTETVERCIDRMDREAVRR